MGTDASKVNESSATAAISLGKDLLSLLRDGALFVLAVLLVAFPAQFNSILEHAGFEEGSIVGFKWRSKLVESNDALKEARATISDLQEKNDELAKALSETNSQFNDPALTERIARLEDENRKLKDTTRQVQTTVSQAIESNIPFVEKALSSTDRRAVGPRTKSDYSVGLQTLGVPDSERAAINEKLRSDGYGIDPITWSYPAGQRPSWFAGRSTVFYYSGSSFSAAQELARFMQSLTGQEFAVQRGAGLGVDPSRKDVTLYVHYVKS
jgi:hypothetical protein